jgi:hypothetical protein
MVLPKTTYSLAFFVVSPLQIGPTSIFVLRPPLITLDLSQKTEKMSWKGALMLELNYTQCFGLGLGSEKMV